MHNSETKQCPQKDIQEPLRGNADILQSSRGLYDDHPIGDDNDPKVVKQRMASFFDAWKHWTTKGRASRSEYCFGILQLIFLESILLLGAFFFTNFKQCNDATRLVPLILPHLVVLWLWGVWTQRRVHDIGLSKGGCLVLILPIIVCGKIVALTKSGLSAILLLVLGFLAFLTLCVRPSEHKTNEHGPVPNVH